MSLTSLQNINFSEGRILCNDLRLTIRKQPKPIQTRGKALLIDERDSKLTNRKISTIMVTEAKTKKPRYLSVIHGIDEDVDNVFLRNSRLNYWGRLGTMLTLLPLLTYIVILYGWMLVYEQLIMKRFAYFTTTTVIILTLIFALCMAVTFIITQFLNVENIREGNFTKLAEHDRAIDYFWEGESRRVEATVLVGYVWHYYTPDSKFISIRDLGTFLAKPSAERRKKIIHLQKKKKEVEKLFKYKKEQENKLKTLEIKKNSMLKRKGALDPSFAATLSEESENMEKLVEKYIIAWTELKDLAITYQKEIDKLNDDAMKKWDNEMKSMIKDKTIQINKEEILRLIEFASEEQHSKNLINFRLMEMQEQVSAMRQQSADSARAAMDVTLAGTPEGRRLSALEQQQELRNQLKRKPIDWNSILRVSIPLLIALLAIGGLVIFAKSISGMDKTESLIWVLGTIVGLAIVGSVLIAIFQTFRTRQPAVRLEGVG